MVHPYCMKKKTVKVASPQVSNTVESSSVNVRKGVAFSAWAAQAYLSKINDARTRGTEFSLTLTEFHNMLRAKRCQLTGLPLTHRMGSNQIATDVTIDRKDSSKGYVKGNVHAVCYAANTFKSQFENPTSVLTPQMLKKIALFATK